MSPVHSPRRPALPGLLGFSRSTPVRGSGGEAPVAGFSNSSPGDDTWAWQGAAPSSSTTPAKGPGKLAWPDSQGTLHLASTVRAHHPFRPGWLAPHLGKGRAQRSPAPPAAPTWHARLPRVRKIPPPDRSPWGILQLLPGPGTAPILTEATVQLPTVPDVPFFVPLPCYASLPAICPFQVATIHGAVLKHVLSLASSRALAQSWNFLSIHSLIRSMGILYNLRSSGCYEDYVRE